MAKIDLSKYGITGATDIVYNPSYELLFEEETKAGLEGYEVGQETELGAVNVMTGIYTGRSPKDKYIVMDENSKDTVWWTSDEYANDNHPMTEETWATVKDIAKKELSNKRLFVVDAFCGANADTRMAVRFIVEVAWQAHFIKNMFIQPTEAELETFEPTFIVYNEIRLEVLKLFRSGLDEHVGYEMCLPSYFYDETDCHTGILVCAAECVNNEQSLVGKFLLSQFLNSLPCFLGSGVVVVLVFIGGPPYGILGIFIHYDELIFRRAAGVDTCHYIDSAELADSALFIAFQAGLCFFFE